MTTDEIMRLAETYRSAWGAYMCGSSPTAGNGMDAAHAALKAAVDTLVAECDALREIVASVIPMLEVNLEDSARMTGGGIKSSPLLDAARAALKGKT